MGSISKRTLGSGAEVWDARIHRRREGGTLTKTFKSQSEAKAFINRIETKIDKGENVSRKAETIFFPDAADQYLKEARPINKTKTITDGERQAIERLKIDFEKFTISNITNGRIQAYIDQFLKTPVPQQKKNKPHPYYNNGIDRKTGKPRIFSKGTVRRHFFILKKILVWHSIKNEYHLDKNLFSMLDIPGAWDNKRERRLEDDELEKLLAATDKGYVNGKEWKLLIKFALATCARCQEIAKAEWSEINKNGMAWNIPASHVKTSTFRQVPLTTEALSVIDELEKTKGDNKRVFHMFANPVAITKGFRRLCVRAGVEDFRFHDLRHSGTAYFFERTDLSDIEIASITGHTNLITLKHYAQLRPSHLAKKMNMVGALKRVQ